MADHNYYNPFIVVAPDTAAGQGTVPPTYRGRETVAGIQHRLLAEQPYLRTQEEVLFLTDWIKQGHAPDAATEADRQAFFAQPRACLRASPLCKQYGWGIHFDSRGHARLVAVDSEDYQRLSQDESLQQLKAMRSSRG